MSGRLSERRVSRATALSVNAVLRGRNLICSLATLPLIQRGPDGTPRRLSLLDQIDPDVTNVVMLAQTLEDLLFESIAWWEIIASDGAGYPTSCRRRDPSSVSLSPPMTGGTPAPLPSGWDPRGASVWVDGREVPFSSIIRFDSPNPGVLHAGARSIRTALLLDAAAAMYAKDPRPLDYFTPTDGADDVDDDEVRGILADWREARKSRSTAWIPKAMTYNTVAAPSPQQLQLVELKKQATIEIANALGVDPEDLGISTTSRTYANAGDRRRDRINDVLSPYMLAITQRLTMGDVTRRGYAVDFDLDNYMKSNPTERWATYSAARALGVITQQEIRDREGWGPMPEELLTTPAEPAPVASVAAQRAIEAQLSDVAPGLKFDGSTPTRFADVPVRSFKVDAKARTIEGIAMPYDGSVASKYGYNIAFVRGALQWTSVNRVKLLRDHNITEPVGVATALTDTAAGLRVQFKVARGPAGDEALSLAEDGVLDGLSVGVDFNESTDTTMNDAGTMMVHRADLREISLTPMPAFDSARVTAVTASRTGGITTMEPCATCGQQHAPGVACQATPTESQPSGLSLNNDQLTALLSRPGAIQALISQQPATPAQPAAPAGGLTLSAEQVDALVRSGQLGTLLGMPQLSPAGPTPEPRPTVNPTRVQASAEVREEAPYRFDRRGNLGRGAHDLSTDLIAGSRGDGEALKRATLFMKERFTDPAGVERLKFDTDKADAAALNPSQQRPEMYVDQQEYTYPIWGAISKGTLTDATPFILPKFASSSGLVAAHVEGTEPTAGVFTATSQTVTPSAVSGIVEITREAWDQGGNPQLSGIIWRQMTRAWFEALEAASVTMLDALTPTALGTFTAGGGTTGQTLALELEQALALLQFARGGFRFRDFFVQVDLYKALVGARDGDGRPLFPLIGGSNANGQVSDYFGDILVGGLRGRPAWALAATGTTAASSYLFDRAGVCGWASAPQRFEFTYQVRYVNLAIWGYKALATIDADSVRELSFDPTA